MGKSKCRYTSRRHRCCKAGAYNKKAGTVTRLSKRTKCTATRKRTRCCKSKAYNKRR